MNQTAVFLTARNFSDDHAGGDAPPRLPYAIHTARISPPASPPTIAPTPGCPELSCCVPRVRSLG